MSPMKTLIAPALLAALLSAPGESPASRPRSASTPISPRIWRSISEAPDAKVVAVAVPRPRARIVHYSLDGRNILWNPDRTDSPGGRRLRPRPRPRAHRARHPVIWDQKHLWAKLGTNIVTPDERARPRRGHAHFRSRSRWTARPARSTSSSG
jgi:hypothetical protein